MLNHQYTMDLLARQRIADLHREAGQGRFAGVKAEPKTAHPHRPPTSVRRLMARLAFAW